MKKELWKRIKKYRFENLVPPTLTERVVSAFGEPDAFTRAFAAKLARKYGWSEKFAFLAIREYKKFVYLGVVSKYPVTPSKTIDIVWHEHAMFTKSYREFCEDVLRQPFDHIPELIPLEEQTNVFNDQYQKTRDFYEHEFGVIPPEEIWGWTKFTPESVTRKPRKPAKRRRESSESTAADDTPLWTMFTPAETAYAPVPVTSDSFDAGGGSFSGGGYTGGSDSGSSSGSDSSSSGGSSGCSSSSCGSSCGGGGCGGGG